MVKHAILYFAFSSLLIPAIATAQSEDDDSAYVYATYYVCDPSAEARADEIVSRNYKPHYDAAVEAGNLLSWSWLAHFVGGDWRRALILTASNMDDLLDASGALGEIIEETTPEAGRAFTEACGTHVDYIWETVADASSAELGAERGEAGFSTYFTCDPSREDEADKLFVEVFGPIHSAQIKADGLTSWIWLKHYVGGTYRRILSLTGSSHKSLLSARLEIQTELQGRRVDRARREFLEICNSHEDYMWDIQVETP